MDNTHFDFHEEIKDENIIPQDVKQIVDKIIRSARYVDFETEVRRVITEINFTSQLYKVNVKGKVDNDQQETNLFIKFLKEKSIFFSFDTELFVHKDLFKIYAELQESAKIDPDERFLMVKFYDGEDTTVALEDLCKRGYEAIDRSEKITLPFAESAVKQLAKFHALSFVLRERNPKYFEQKLINMEYLVVRKDIFKVYKHVAQRLANISTEYILDADMKRRFKKFMSTKYIETYQQSFSRPDSKYACLCHGDYHQYNIMIKKDRSAVHTMMVDLQTVHYNYPVTDLIYLIFSKSDSEFRRRNMSNIKDIYYKALCEFLQKFDVDASVYPRVEFEKQFKENLGHGLVTGLTISAVSYADPKDLPAVYEALETTNLDEPMGEPLHLKVEAQGVKLVQDLVNDFGCWGYF